ncbi:putative Uncharacterized 50.6 kDa protein in the 5'region of gyrA and gyrB [Aeromicrobium sp. 9AM]|nr:putative Uncharacterized 50.6 kDa protein in the 5'region of gyrA and gyrB [Aeromicrobium sp. 9AM]
MRPRDGRRDDADGAAADASAFGIGAPDAATPHRVPGDALLAPGARHRSHGRRDTGGRAAGRRPRTYDRSRARRQAHPGTARRRARGRARGLDRRAVVEPGVGAGRHAVLRGWRQPGAGRHPRTARRGLGRQGAQQPRRPHHGDDDQRRRADPRPGAAARPRVGREGRDHLVGHVRRAGAPARRRRLATARAQAPGLLRRGRPRRGDLRRRAHRCDLLTVRSASGRVVRRDRRADAGAGSGPRRRAYAVGGRHAVRRHPRAHVARTAGSSGSPSGADSRGTRRHGPTCVRTQRARTGRHAARPLALALAVEVHACGSTGPGHHGVRLCGRRRAARRRVVAGRRGPRGGDDRCERRVPAAPARRRRADVAGVRHGPRRAARAGPVAALSRGALCLRCPLVDRRVAGARRSYAARRAGVARRAVGVRHARQARTPLRSRLVAVGHGLCCGVRPQPRRHRGPVDLEWVGAARARHGAALGLVVGLGRRLLEVDQPRSLSSASPAP